MLEGQRYRLREGLEIEYREGAPKSRGKLRFYNPDVRSPKSRDGAVYLDVEEVEVLFEPVPCEPAPECPMCGASSSLDSDMEPYCSARCRRDDGQERCEGCGKWFEMTEGRSDDDGVWLCGDCAPVLEEPSPEWRRYRLRGTVWDVYGRPCADGTREFACIKADKCDQTHIGTRVTVAASTINVLFECKVFGFVLRTPTIEAQRHSDFYTVRVHDPDIDGLFHGEGIPAPTFEALFEPVPEVKPDPTPIDAADWDRIQTLADDKLNLFEMTNLARAVRELRESIRDNDAWVGSAYGDQAGRLRALNEQMNIVIQQLEGVDKRFENTQTGNNARDDRIDRHDDRLANLERNNVQTGDRITLEIEKVNGVERYYVIKEVDHE